MKFKFIHAADLHIDSPMIGLDAYESAPIERLRGATREAMRELVALAIRESVDAVLLVGDIFDGDWADFRTGLFFRDQLVKLTASGVRVYIVKGNHDAASLITRQLPSVAGVHVFSHLKAETVDLPDLGVAIHGRSFPQRAVPEDLVPSYPMAISDRFNIGLLHTSLNGREGHDPYAPTSVDTLCSKGYDYFALGHVHKREVIQDKHPRIVFPGNIQGRHAKEIGSKGCDLVMVEDGDIVSSEHIPLDAIRWGRIELDVTDISTLDDLARAFTSKATDAIASVEGRLLAARVNISGETALHAVEAASPGTIAAALQATAQDLGEDIWIEQIRAQLTTPFDRKAAAERQDAVGEVIRLTDELTADGAKLRQWFIEQLAELPPLPSVLADEDPRNMDIEAIRALVNDAGATVLAQLAHLAETEARS